MQSEPKQQPIIAQKENFIVKVKLLIYQINTLPNVNLNFTKIAISELKKLIYQKTHIPVEKQRLIFSGKQLFDVSELSDYLKESGLILHLLAKSVPPQQLNAMSQQQKNDIIAQQSPNSLCEDFRTSQNQQNRRAVPPAQLGTLHQLINRVAISQEQQTIPDHLNQREEAALYLRRLHSQTLRFIPQLNRAIKLLSEGRITHLVEILPAFQLLNEANLEVFQVIQRLLLTVNTPNSHSSKPIHQNRFNSNIRNQNIYNQPLHHQIQRIGNSQLTQNITNFHNSLSSNIPPQQKNPHNFPQVQQSKQDNCFSQQFTNIPTTIIHQRQQLESQSTISQQLNSITIPGRNQNGQPTEGVNFMSLFSSMQQNGGIGNILSTSLGDMVDQGKMDPIYRHIFKAISGGQIISIFTTKSFSFLNTKKVQLRQALLKATSSAGSHQQLISRYSKDLSTIFIPSGQIKNKQLCIKKLIKILKNHIERIIVIILESAIQINIQTLILTQLKLIFCESVEELCKFCANKQLVFSYIKTNTIAKIDRFAQGMSTLFYSFIERDLIGIYREYCEEEGRKRQRSELQAKDEAELLKQIDEQSSKDVEYMAGYQHSNYYPFKP